MKRSIGCALRGLRERGAERRPLVLEFLADLPVPPADLAIFELERVVQEQHHAGDRREEAGDDFVPEWSQQFAVRIAGDQNGTGGLKIMERHRRADAYSCARKNVSGLLNVLAMPRPRLTFLIDTLPVATAAPSCTYVRILPRFL